MRPPWKYLDIDSSSDVEDLTESGEAGVRLGVGFNPRMPQRSVNLQNYVALEPARKGSSADESLQAGFVLDHQGRSAQLSQVLLAKLTQDAGNCLARGPHKLCHFFVSQ